jgi:hypothetical protein
MPVKNPHSNLARLNVTEAANASLGQNGWTLVTGTSANTDGYNAIMVVESAVFSAIVGTGITSTGIGSVAALPVGFVIFGNITSFTLTSGKVIAYLSGVPL